MIESSTRWIVLAALLAGGCSNTDDGEGRETDTSGPGTSGSSTLESSTLPADPSSSSSADDTSAAVSSSSDAADSESTAGVEPECGAGEPGILFSSAETIGTIPYPSGAPYLWGMQSWYEPASGSSAESAEDFEVPAGSCWCITSVNVIGQFTTTPRSPELALAFYDDLDGLPVESPWLTEIHVPTASTPLRGYEPPLSPVSHMIDLDEAALVPAGRAWLSMVGVVVGPNRFDLNLTPDTFGNLSTAYRRAPDCPEWQHVNDCYPHLPAAEVAFELHGWAVACD